MYTFNSDVDGAWTWLQDEQQIVTLSEVVSSTVDMDKRREFVNEHCWHLTQLVYGLWLSNGPEPQRNENLDTLYRELQEVDSKRAKDMGWITTVTHTKGGITT